MNVLLWILNLYHLPTNTVYVPIYHAKKESDLTRVEKALGVKVPEQNLGGDMNGAGGLGGIPDGPDAHVA